VAVVDEQRERSIAGTCSVMESRVFIQIKGINIERRSGPRYAVTATKRGGFPVSSVCLGMKRDGAGGGKHCKLPLLPLCRWSGEAIAILYVR